jgi:hypothetical protein
MEPSKKISLGELVRRACRDEYGLRSYEDRRRAVAELLSLELPVGSPEEMKRESVPAAGTRTGASTISLAPSFRRSSRSPARSSTSPGISSTATTT